MNAPAEYPARCLAHGCQKADQCARHLVIRGKRPPPDGNVQANLCASGHHFEPAQKEANNGQL